MIVRGKRYEAPVRRKVSHMTGWKGNEEKEKGATGKGSGTGSTKKPPMKVCHPSVCVGDAAPTNCVCPTPKKK